MINKLLERSTIKDNGCWEWNAASDENGYGKVWFEGKLHSVHRVSWLLHNGVIPKGIRVLHRCDNPHCWNPVHLFLGTQQDNVDDMVAKGRAPCRKGSLGPRALLNDNLVKEILLKIGKYSNADLGREYGVSRWTILDIKKQQDLDTYYTRRTNLSISKSRGAYQDCRDLFERAMEDSKGCRIYIGEQGIARHFVMRMHQAREIERRDNRSIYEFGHPMHGTSIWDKFKCSMRPDRDGNYWVYVQKVELDLGAVENLSELVDYEFAEPAPQIARQQTLVIEHQPMVIRRRV